MDDIFTYIVPLPIGIDEVVLPCADWYTVYLSDRLDTDGRLREYRHAVCHITNGDFAKVNVQEIEYAIRKGEDHVVSEKKEDASRTNATA